MKMTEIIKELVNILSHFDGYTQYIEDYNQMISTQKRNTKYIEQAENFLEENGIHVKDTRAVIGLTYTIVDANKRSEEDLNKLYEKLYIEILYHCLDSKLGNSPFCKDIAMKNGDILRFNSVSKFKVNVYKKGNTYMHNVDLMDVAKQIYNDYCA